MNEDIPFSSVVKQLYPHLGFHALLFSFYIPVTEIFIYLFIFNTLTLLTNS